MGQQEMLHWRLFFQHLLSQASAKTSSSRVGTASSPAPDNALWQAFLRMASQPKLQVLFLLRVAQM